MFEQAFKNVDDVLGKEAGCTTELDYTETFATSLSRSSFLGAKLEIGTNVNSKQQTFRDFALSHYVNVGRGRT